MYGLVDELNDTTTEMIGMKSKDAIKLDEVHLVNGEAPEGPALWRITCQKINYQRMDCISTYYNLVKNTTTNGAEQQIEYGLREPTN